MSEAADITPCLINPHDLSQIRWESKVKSNDRLFDEATLEEPNRRDLNKKEKEKEACIKVSTII